MHFTKCVEFCQIHFVHHLGASYLLFCSFILAFFFLVNEFIDVNFLFITVSVHLIIFAGCGFITSKCFLIFHALKLYLKIDFKGFLVFGFVLF